MESVSRLVETILFLWPSYPDLRYTVFIHKTDSLSADYQEDTVSDIKQRIMDDLNDAGLENPAVTFYETSVYDHSIFEALSKVIQVLNPQLATFENLLTTISASCKMQKLYLFDVYTKLYVASDTAPADIVGYGLCSDFIDTIVDLSEIYGWERDEPQKIANGDEHAGESGELISPRFEEGGAESFVSGIRGACLYLKEMNKCVSRASWRTTH